MNEEPPRLLWRSIVFGFGFAAAAFLFTAFLLAVIVVTLAVAGRPAAL